MENKRFQKPSELLRPTWIEIDLDAVGHNMREVRRLARSTEVCAVVKADAYGHGAVAIGETLLANGADRFAVATADEALELRAVYPEVPILVLGEIADAAVGRLAEAGVAVALTSFRRAETMERILSDGGSKRPLAVHVKLDTGMSRIGFCTTTTCERSIEEVLELRRFRHIVIEGIFSHFATADESDKSFAHLQLKRYNDFCDALVQRGMKLPLRHIANSAAIIDMPEAHFDMVRAGIVLYGLAPSEEVAMNRIDLKPTLSLRTQVVFVKELEAGVGIGYSHLYRTTAPTRIATLPIGYADGLERGLSNRLIVLHRGRRVPQRGRICMDQIMIEVDEAEVGDPVVILGSQGSQQITIDEYAELFGTNNYEVICSMGPRIPRIYTNKS